MAQARLEEIAAAIRDRRRFLLVTHRGPDGDGIGSMVGCASILRELGKEAVLFLPDGAPEALQGLEGVRKAVRSLPKSERFDATIVFDTGDPRLLEGALPPPEQSGCVLVLDHHRVSVDYGDLCWRQPEEAAVGVMVYRLAQALGAPLDAASAQALYVSIVSDTGGFRYSNATAEVFRITADLVDRGAEPWTATQAMLESYPATRLKLLAQVLGTLEITLGGRFATLSVTDEMLKQTGAHPEMTAGFVSYARAIRGVEVGALISKKGASVRVSLRGRGRVDVAQVAAAFGGGGHHDAAGCEVSAHDIATARARVEQEIAKALGLQAGPCPGSTASSS